MNRMTRRSRTNRGITSRRSRRAGLASLEVVMTTAVAFPIAAGLWFLQMQICKHVYHAIAAIVGGPFL